MDMFLTSPSATTDLSRVHFVEPGLQRGSGTALVMIAILVGAALSFSAQASAEPQDTVDVSRLPLNLERIERGLRLSTIREERDGLKIRYVVDVYGQAPSIVIFTPEDNLVSGPVPYGAPTHKEIVEYITPKEYRAPAADLSALLRWLADRAGKK